MANARLQQQSADNRSQGSAVSLSGYAQRSSSRTVLKVVHQARLVTFDSRLKYDAPYAAWGSHWCPTLVC